MEFYSFKMSRHVRFSDFMVCFVFIFSVRLRNETWMNVQVGDIIKLENNKFVTVSVEMLRQSFIVVNFVKIMAFYVRGS